MEGKRIDIGPDGFGPFWRLAFKRSALWLVASGYLPPSWRAVMTVVLLIGLALALLPVLFGSEGWADAWSNLRWAGGYVGALVAFVIGRALVEAQRLYSEAESKARPRAGTDPRILWIDDAIERCRALRADILKARYDDHSHADQFYGWINGFNFRHFIELSLADAQFSGELTQRANACREVQQLPGQYGVAEKWAIVADFLIQRLNAHRERFQALQ